jgi:hypothetical protein
MKKNCKSKMRRDVLLRQYNTTCKPSLCFGAKFGLRGKGNWIEDASNRLLQLLLGVTLRDRIPNENKKSALLQTENMLEQVWEYHLNWQQTQIFDALKAVSILRPYGM